MTEATRRTGRWLQRFRTNYLRLHPLCARCSTSTRPVIATQVDHKVALVNGGADFDADPSNAQGLCESCHVVKTAEDLGHTERPQFNRSGRIVW